MKSSEKYSEFRPIVKVAKFASFQSSQIADLAGLKRSANANITTETAIDFAQCCHLLLF